MKTLQDVKVTTSAKVIKLHGTGAVKEELWIWELLKVQKYLYVKLHH